ncbi:hypothetical protein EON67_06560 [archaeon]|nr:MAG: hypothetical protein EON67_06560 [archaeon]
MQDRIDYLRSAIVWSLGQIGKHSTSHANALAGSDALRYIIDLLNAETSSDDLREKCKRCLKGACARPLP